MWPKLTYFVPAQISLCVSLSIFFHSFSLPFSSSLSITLFLSRSHSQSFYVTLSLSQLLYLSLIPVLSYHVPFFSYPFLSLFLVLCLSMHLFLSCPLFLDVYLSRFMSLDVFLPSFCIALSPSFFLFSLPFLKCLSLPTSIFVSILPCFLFLCVSIYLSLSVFIRLSFFIHQSLSVTSLSFMLDLFKDFLISSKIRGMCY
jgi:hypothetical protein